MLWGGNKILMKDFNIIILMDVNAFSRIKVYVNAENICVFSSVLWKLYNFLKIIDQMSSSVGEIRDKEHLINIQYENSICIKDVWFRVRK